jgi:hypothetical protein
VSDGTRTHDRLDHNQELYQLSYAHRGTVESTSAGRCGRPRSVGAVRVAVGAQVHVAGEPAARPGHAPAVAGAPEGNERDAGEQQPEHMIEIAADLGLHQRCSETRQLRRAQAPAFDPRARDRRPAGSAIMRRMTDDGLSEALSRRLATGDMR